MKEIKKQISDQERFNMIKQIQEVFLNTIPGLTELKDETIWKLVEEAKMNESYMINDEEIHKRNHIEFAKKCKHTWR